MTLCGVLKDILLVFASIAIWGTPISGLQSFGYAIALGGLVYYKLGVATIKAQFLDVSRQWAEFGSNRLALRKVIVFGGILMMLFVVLGGLAPSVGYDSKYLNSIKGADTPS